MNHLRRSLLLAFILVLAAGANAVAAFQFADGTSLQCIARGEVVTEIYAQATDPWKPDGRTALAARNANGWQITWNVERLQGLPPEVRDFLFFHECAHIRVPTENELEANCAGLKEMRATGRATPAYEVRLRRFFPADNDYWNATFRCANGVRPVPSVPAPQ